MINHTDCDHPSTSGARAKCRRARSEGKVVVTTLGPHCDDCTHESCTRLRPKAGATPKYIGKAHHDPDRPRNQGTTPRDKDKQCMNCGVERIEFKGTDPFTGMLLFVGERCTYKVENSDDFAGVMP